MAICTRCAQAAVEAAEIRTAQRMVVDAVLVVEAGVMSSRRHSGPGGSGRGIGVPTAANGCAASPQPTAPPLLSHHRLPSPPRLPTLPSDPPPPAAGVQDCLRLPQRLISAQCCGRWRTRWVTVLALAAGAAIGAKVLPAEWD
jgi:hypothetical protein